MEEDRTYQTRSQGYDLDGVEVGPRGGSRRTIFGGLVVFGSAVAALGVMQHGGGLGLSTGHAGSDTELGSLKSAYCNLTISKQTWSVSDPTAAGDFMLSLIHI